MSLEDRVVAITGASSGIGEALALRCSDSGAAVGLGARRAERLSQLAQRISRAGGRALAVPTDVRCETQARAFVEHVHRELGKLDVLVNNAGVMLLGPIAAADIADWQQMVEVNLLGTLYSTHAAIPLMQAAGGGHVVIVSSVAGRQARPGNGVYAATKFGVGAFAESLRQEMAPHGIRVTTVEPGFTDTELASHLKDPAAIEFGRRARAEIGRILSADDIAKAIVDAVSLPDHVNVCELLVRPTRQAH